MSIANKGIKRRPTHPGEMLREDFLPDYGLTVSALAQAIGVSRHVAGEMRRDDEWGNIVNAELTRQDD